MDLFNPQRFLISAVVGEMEGKFKPEEVLELAKEANGKIKEEYREEIDREEVMEVLNDFVKEDMLLRKGDYFEKFGIK